MLPHELNDGVLASKECTCTGGFGVKVPVLTS
jgi:hypothetical protein